MSFLKWNETAEGQSVLNNTQTNEKDNFSSSSINILTIKLCIHRVWRKLCKELQQLSGIPLIQLKMKKIVIICSAILTLSSCGMMNKLTPEQLYQRSKIDYELNKLYNEYQVKNDSLLIE